MPSRVQQNDDDDRSAETLTDGEANQDEDGEQREDSKREQSKRHKPGGFFCHHDGLQTTNKLCTHKCGFLCLLHTQNRILLPQQIHLRRTTVTVSRRRKGARKDQTPATRPNHPTDVPQANAPF